MISEELDKRGEAAYNAYQAARKRYRENNTPENEEACFKAWKAWKQIAPLIIINGGEEIPQEDPLYSVYQAIRKHCIKGAFPSSMGLYFIPEDEQAENPYTLASYKEGIIKINRQYYQEHGIDEDTINTMFHEMIHGYCDMKPFDKKIKDTEGEYHLKAFAEACEANGGTCDFVNSKMGYSDARLTPESLENVRAELWE